MPLEAISHYRIVKKLGAGGMGEVYLAEDTNLERNVAIKLLRSESSSDETARRRLIREAQSAAKLDHPNICSVYEVGEQGGRSFIVMQYVEGETLADKIKRRRLDLKESIGIAIQAVDALCEAHSHGIIHRDVKPQNIIITRRGQVKVLDFGLAKQVFGEAPWDTRAETLMLVTEPGLVLGTIPYMSPEQIKGETLDARTDIFSCGAMIYEMVSGKHPFAAETAGNMLAAILTCEPIPVSRHVNVPVELQRIISKCLQKDREQRYQSARDLVIDLSAFKRNLDSASVKEPVGNRAGKAVRRGKNIDSLAVLPFTNMSSDPKIEYLIDGITENIINSLSQLPKLKVMARNTVFRYKDKHQDCRKIGQELNVRVVLVGRVLLLEDRLTIGVELVEVADGSQLWGQQYNRKLLDIFTIQEEIAREISDRLRLKLSVKEKKGLVKRATDNIEAFQLYLRGRYFWNKRPAGLSKGIEYFQAAIEKDPAYALAYTGLADSYSALGSWESGVMSPQEAMPKARAAVMKALEIDATIAEAHTSLAYCKMHYDWDWAGSEIELRQALELNQNYSTAHHWYSHKLMYMGRVEESLVESRLCLELDPLDLILNIHLGWHYYFARQFDKAIDQQQKTAEMEPHSVWPHFELGRAYEQEGMYKKAIIEFKKAEELSPNSTFVKAGLAHVFAISGEAEAAHAILEELKRLSNEQFVPSYDIAVIYVGLRQKLQAFEWLDKANKERSGWMAYLNIEPRLDYLRSDPRFQDLLSRVGLGSD